MVINGHREGAHREGLGGHQWSSMVIEKVLRLSVAIGWPSMAAR